MFLLVLSGPAQGQSDHQVAFDLRWRDMPDGTIIHKISALLSWELELYAGFDPNSQPANEGLAGFCADLVQDEHNPSSFDIPPADPTSLPPEMSGFSYPAGISNLSDDGGSSGYFGVQRGAEGAKNLIQIGGMQNSFGTPGMLMGTDPVVETDVAHTPVVAIGGAFPVPRIAGTYVIRLQSARATVFEQVQAPPDPSVVRWSTTNLSTPGISFVSCIGDIDRDGDVDLADLATLLGAYGQCEGHPLYNPEADLDSTGCVGLADLAELLGYYGVQCLE
jgi:hypothetical protein